MSTVWLRRVPQVLLLTVVWVLLWGTVSVKIVLGGLLVGAAVAFLFPLPVENPAMPIRPWRLLQLAGYLLADLVISGVQVSWETLRYGSRARAGIVAVPLLSRSGRVVTVVAGGVVLTPGSYVLQIDQRGGLAYVYNLGLRSAADAERARRQVLKLQLRVIAALGSADELVACQRALDRSGR
ncbi:Na+/H+ antiporter subunit E [Pseudonocardia asaccharolytica]|uniref:Na+/H+ antiporter subunit E n=1 Tax=Pseudonocardia asaccharolytica DSM 44247 = NBRC 16224 TaxID=1123024 RepID=A0A511D3A7_9PSEU|nr:Na+/H+ antiporter subunit E [Pseudonocardia asaccharolytica]GEL19269.1 Na+/H+ antiporter subunit E [Pseudonocardia asaccharolytica DSM 44247 = NBRC 16224]